MYFQAINLKLKLMRLLNTSFFTALLVALTLTAAAQDTGQLPAFRADHVAVGTTDYPGTVAWYSRMLDMKVLMEWEDKEAEIQFAYLEAPSGFRVEVIAAKQTFTEPKTPGGRLDHLYSKGYTQLAFVTDDVDGMMQTLEKRGAHIFREAKDIHVIKRRIGMVLDNNGNLVELIELMK